MTEKQLKARVAYWQRELSHLGVSHWRLDSLEVVDSEERYHASVLPSGYYDRFKLRFDASYVKNADEREIDETIIHELIHVAMRDLDAVAERLLEHAPGGTDGPMHEDLRRAREGSVGRCATQIADAYYES